MSACSQNTTISTIQTPFDNLCACIDSIQPGYDRFEDLNADMSCIKMISGNDKDTFDLALNYAFNNCKGFARRVSELNLTMMGHDSIPFVKPNPELCMQNHHGKWRDILSNDSTYSVFYKDRVEHFKADAPVGKWIILSRENCQTTYLVTEQDIPYPFPPNLGDTVVTTTIGISENYLKNIVKIGEVEVVTIGIRVE